MVAASCFSLSLLCFVLVSACAVLTVSEPDLSYLKGLCSLMFCVLAVFCRLNTAGRWSLAHGSAFLHLAMVLFLGRQESGQWCYSCPLVIQGMLVMELSLG